MNDKKLVKVGQSGTVSAYMVGNGVMSASNSADSSMSSYTDAPSLFDGVDESIAGNLISNSVSIGGKDYKYVSWGDDNKLPFKLRTLIRKNMVTARSQAFNIQACYGQGIRFINRATKQDVDDVDIREFCMANASHETFLEQCTDMKYYFMNICTIVLSRDHSKIVNIRRQDVCYCRLGYPSAGRIDYIIVGDFLNSDSPSKARKIPLLDIYDPLSDLRERTGQNDKKGKNKLPDGADCEFAILCRIPTPGALLYPIPYYASIFDDAWYDIYNLIGLGKRWLIKNTSAPRMQIEVHNDYFSSVCQAEHITEPDKIKARITQEQQNIIDFVCGVENAGKALITKYYIDPNGKENRMVRVINLNETGSKEGGDWADDMSEASNALCFALGVHPNLIGATPGKSQMNNSGSDKRELFILKQSLEKASHDIMLKPWHVILHYNGWAKKGITVDVPMIELTTLDKNKDQQTSLVTNVGNNDDSNK